MSDAINKPLGLMVIILVGIFIIKMRGNIKTYGINNGNNRSYRNNGNNGNFAMNGNNGNNRQGNGNNGNNRRRIGNIGRTALAIGDFYIAIRFGLFVFFLSLLIFLASIIEKASKDRSTKNKKSSNNVGAIGPRWTWDKSMEKPAGKKDMGGWVARVYTPEQMARLGVDEEGNPSYSKDQRYKGDIAFWLVGLFIGAAMTGAGKGKYFWPPWLVIAAQDLIRFSIIGKRARDGLPTTPADRTLNLLFLIINISLMVAVVYNYSWSTLGKGGIIFLTSVLLAGLVAVIVMKIAEQENYPRKKIYKKSTKQAPSKPSDGNRTWPSFDGRGGKA